ncbi:MAG: hypothetical protein QF886_25740, partial [Planctomycetota bacterium]|nr:hypothetical protein [Planctomycetota bacterium]
MVALLALAAAAFSEQEYQFSPQPLPAQFAIQGQLGVQAIKSRDASLDLALHHTEASGFLELKLSKRTATLTRVIGKQRRQIVEGKMPSLSNGTNFRIFRDSWRTLLIVNGQQVLQGSESSLTEARLGVRQHGKGLSLKGISVQPTSEIYFADDFTRNEEQQGEWEHITGEFHLHRLKAKKYSKRVYSANSFRWESSGSVDFAIAGHWFWRNLHFAASVRPITEGSLGLAVWAQDANNYVLFKIKASRSHRLSQWIRVRKGKAEVLASSPVGLEINQWYRLDVRAVDGRLEAGVDGKLVVSADCDSWQSGRIGIYAENILAHIDDIAVRTTDGFHANGASLPRANGDALPGFPQTQHYKIGSKNWANATVQFE